MGRHLLVFVCWALSACAGPVAGPRARLAADPVPRSEGATTAETPRAIASSAVDSVALKAPLKPTVPISRIRPPSDTSCVFRSASWTGALQLRPKGPIYGNISSGAVVVNLGSETRDGSAVIEAGGARVKLFGVVDDPELFLRKPTTLSSFVLPHAETSLSWQPTGTAERVAVSLDVSDSFEVPAVAQAVVACDKLTIDEPAYDALASIAPQAMNDGSIYGAIELLLAPGGRPVARTKANSTHDVLVIRTTAQHSRVAIKGQGYYAIGWIDSNSIGRLGMRGRGVRGPRVRMATGSSNTRFCTHSLPLIAEMEGERANVGVLAAGTQFESSSLDIEAGFVGVELFETWFVPTPGAKLLIAERDLAGC
jgi:hypothetical protein